MINCDWIDEQPAFFKDVMDKDGNKIATIHALTKLDRAEIRRKADTKTEIGKNGEMYFITNPEKLEIVRIYVSLTGHKKAGWELDREVTEDNIDAMPTELREAINKAIVDLEEQNEITEDLEKNS